MGINRVLDGEIVVRKRFGEEWTNVRDFIRPSDHMVRDLIASRPSWTARELWEWVITRIRYPAGSFLLQDRHVLLAFRPQCGLLCDLVGFFFPGRAYATIDYWNFPAETLRDRQGDCEDSTFLLVSLLRCALPGIPAYATVGTFEEYGHVWTSVFDEGIGDYLVMDTTLPRLPDNAPIESRTGAYQPLFRFNEEVQIVESAEIVVPANLHELGKDKTVRDWYVITGLLSQWSR